MDKILKKLDFTFLSKGGHKVSNVDFLDLTDATLLDVRTNEEVHTVNFSLEGLVAQSLHIPLNELPERLSEVPSNGVVGLLCVSDVRSAMAYIYLQSKGFINVRVLVGGSAGLLEELKTGKVRKRLFSNKK
jgi:rhodanese-related sulfurtransferase